MNNSYDDIRSRIAEEPKWWDENAVPRYCDFKPDEAANIYAHECILVLIKCQNCGHEFKVLFSDATSKSSVEDMKRLHYGDPPNAGCCLSGPTMNSVPCRVLEFWRMGGEEFTEPDPHDPELRICKEGYFEWRRISDMEIEIPCEWNRDFPPNSKG